MGIWLLNHIPTTVLAVLVVGGSIAWSGLGLIVVRRRWPQLAAGEHNDVAGVMLQVVGAVYGIMLAFVVVSVYASYSDAQHTVRAEASYIAQLGVDTHGLDVGPAIAAEVGAYVHDVVEDEWPAMATGESSPKVQADLVALFGTMRLYNPSTQAEIAFYTAAVTDLNNVVNARRDRLFDANQELPGVLQVLLYGGAAILTASTWLLGMRRFRIQLLMVAGVAALVGFSLFVVIVIDHPFSGDVAVSTLPFRIGVLAAFW